MLKIRNYWDIGIPTFGWDDLPIYNPEKLDVYFQWPDDSMSIRIMVWDWKSLDNSLKLLQICEIEHIDNINILNYRNLVDKNGLVPVKILPAFRFSQVEIAVLFKLSIDF